MATPIDDIRNFRDEFVSCSICFSTLDQPRMLSCLHTFCLSCLIEFVNRSTESGSIACCPHCRTPMPQTTEELRALPTNFLVNRLLDLKVPSREDNEVQYCDPCNDGSDGPRQVAAMYCVNCEEKLCEECVNAHRKLKISKEHSLVSLDLVGMKKMKEVLKNMQTVCSLHSDSKLEMYCETCLAAICMKCCILKHKNHNNIELSEAGDRCRSELANIIEKVTKAVDSVNINVTNLHTMRQKKAKKYNHMKAKLEERARMLTAEIEIQKNNLLSEIDCDYSKIEKAFDDIAHSEGERINSLKVFLQLCLKNHEEGSDSELVTMAEKFKSKAAEMQSKACDSISSVHIEFGFIPGTTDKNNTSQKVKSLIGGIQFQMQFQQSLQSHSGFSKSPMPIEKSTQQGEKKMKQEMVVQVRPNEIKQQKADGQNASISLRTTGNQASESRQGAIGNNSSTVPNLTLTATLDSLIFQSGLQPIQGVIVWNQKLYITRKMSAYIEVYNAGKADANLEMQQHVPGLVNPTDLVVNRKTGHIFLSDANTNSIFVLFHNVNGSFNIMKFSIDFKPNSLSFTPEGNLLITATDEMKLLEHAVTGELIREISTTPNRPHHAIKIACNNYVAALLKNSAYTVCRLIVDKDFKIQREEQYNVKLNVAKHLAVDSRLNLLLVADTSGNRVVALQVKDHRAPGVSVIDCNRITQPHRITVDPTTGQLYVGCSTGTVSKFNLKLTQQKESKGSGNQQEKKQKAGLPSKLISLTN